MHQDALKLVLIIKQKHNNQENYNNEFDQFVLLCENDIKKAVSKKFNVKTDMEDYKFLELYANAILKIKKDLYQFDEQKGQLFPFIEMLVARSYSNEKESSTDEKIKRAFDKYCIENETIDCSPEELHDFIVENSIFSVSLDRIKQYFADKMSFLSDDDQTFVAASAACEDEDFETKIRNTTTLTPQEKEIVVLHLIYKLKFTDIGKKYHLARSTIQQKFKTAYIKMKLEIKK